MSGGMIFISKDKDKPVHEGWVDHFVNDYEWEAFSEMIDNVLLSSYPSIRNMIIDDESIEFFHYHYFHELNGHDFNLVINLFDGYQENKTSFTEKEKVARTLWFDFIRPDMIKDQRFKT